MFRRVRFCVVACSVLLALISVSGAAFADKHGGREREREGERERTRW